MTDIKTLTADVNAVDREWSAELTCLFGKRACDARYLPEGKGAPGSALRDIYDRRTVAIVRRSDAWAKLPLVPLHFRNGRRT